METDEAIDRYGPLILSLIWRITHNSEDTADIYQDVFVKLHDTQAKHGALGQPKAWLCRTATNAALDQIRQRKRFVALEYLAEPPNANGLAEESENAMLTERIRLLVPRLPERQGAVFSLRYIEGLSFGEIATIVESSPGAARAAAFQATSKIREWLNSPRLSPQPNKHTEESP